MAQNNRRTSRSPSSSRLSSTNPSARIEQVLNLNTLQSPPRSPGQSVLRNAPPRLGEPISLNSSSYELPVSASSSGRPIRHANSYGLSVSAGARVASSPIAMAASVPATTAILPGTTARAASGTFTPRIVRGTAESSATSSRSPFASPTPSSRPRRASSTLLSFARNNSQTSIVTTAAAIGQTSRGASSASVHQVTLPTPPPSFPRPAYLEHTALYDLLHSETPPSLPPNRYRFDGAERDSSFSSPNAEGKLLFVLGTPGMDTDEEDNDVNISDPSAPLPRRPPPTNYQRLPTRWSEQDRSSNLSISPDGAELVFNGPQSYVEREAAAARTNFHIPPACGIYYYEVEVVNRGAKGHISIGFSASSVRLTRLPGWEGHSWGYHGDDGQAFASDSEGKPYGPTYTSGDVVGCGIDFSLHRVFYTRNGSFLGLVFENVGSNCQLYPAVGMRTPNERIRANFGQDPFKFDISSYVLNERNRVWSVIQHTPVTVTTHTQTGAVNFTSGPSQLPSMSIASFPPKVSSSDPVNEVKHKLDEVIMAYLNHHGYSKTVRALKLHHECRIPPALVNNAPSTQFLPGEDMDLDTDAEDNDSANLRPGRDDLGTRIQILTAVQRGDIDTALAGTQMHYPGVLDAENGLMRFKLRCRKLIELILESAETSRNGRRPQSEATLSAVGNRPWSTSSPPHLESQPMADGVFEMDSMDLDPDIVAPLVMNGHTPSLKGKMRQSDPRPSRGHSGSEPGLSRGVQEEYQRAFGAALSYGQKLGEDIKNDKRDEVVVLFKKTTSLLAFSDPMNSTDKETVEFASPTARIQLAAQLNKAILASLGQPVDPVLERLYRQGCAVVKQLGCLGEGAAAFADARRELLEASV